MHFFDYLPIFFFLNNILVTIIFWFLTIVGTFFFHKNEFMDKNSYYECGFKSLTDFNFKINMSILITMVFVIFYDLEFIFTIPYLLNNNYIYMDNYFLVFVFYFTILSTFIIDIYEDVLSWDF